MAVGGKSHTPGSLFPDQAGNLVDVPKVHSFGGALGGTRGPQAAINTLDAEIALNGFSGSGVDLRNCPWASIDAHPTAEQALVLVDQDNAIAPLVNGSHGAGGHTPRLTAVVAKHGQVARPDVRALTMGAKLVNPDQARASR